MKPLEDDHQISVEDTTHLLTSIILEVQFYNTVEAIYHEASINAPKAGSCVSQKPMVN